MREGVPGRGRRGPRPWHGAARAPARQRPGDLRHLLPDAATRPLPARTSPGAGGAVAQRPPGGPDRRGLRGGLRIGELDDSSLVARPLAPYRLKSQAIKSYLRSLPPTSQRRLILIRQESHPLKSTDYNRAEIEEPYIMRATQPRSASDGLTEET